MEGDLQPTPEEAEPLVQVNTLNVDSVSPIGHDGRDVELLRALGMDATKLTFRERDQLTGLILHYRDVFAMTEDELGATSIVEHQIDTQQAEPIKQYARRIPRVVRSRVEALVSEMLDRTKSPWSSPIMLVAKKDGSTRFCVDYRKLNQVTKRDVFPLPRIEDCMDELAGSKYFTTLDLDSGFWQVRMEDESVEKTAFATHCGCIRRAT